MYNKRSLLLLFVLSLLCTGCSFNTFSNNRAFCENHFSLTSDFNKVYVDEGNYLDFLSTNSYIDTYYYKNDNGFNIHYYLEFLDGSVVDKWGNYEIHASFLNASFPDDTEMSFEFSYYNSPTIDYILISPIEIDNNVHHLVYSARYYYSSEK